VHKQQLAASLKDADDVILYQPKDVDWGMQSVVNDIVDHAALYNDVDDIVNQLTEQAKPGDHILVMSNGAFGGIHQKILDALTR
jgi:UDP-N-acetylmuramate: L-alanyl-gamma-D-glutamyl-meso-diaminopimelate ligase